LCAIALAFAYAACVEVEPEPEPEPQQTCEDSELRILEISQDMIAEFASPCDVDADCEIVGISADCPNGEPFHMPDEAIAFARFQEARAFVASRAGDVCLSEQCSFPRFDNFYGYAYCDDGVCRGTIEDPEFVCGSIAERLDNVVLQATNALPNECTEDADCVLSVPEWRCDEFGHVVTACAVIAADQTLVIQEAALADACIDHPFECVIEAPCGDVVIPACIEGVCVNNEG
jgi:hypothetical protein